jgi:hypothetical protein
MLGHDFGAPRPLEVLGRHVRFHPTGGDGEDVNRFGRERLCQRLAEGVEAGLARTIRGRIGFAAKRAARSDIHDATSTENGVGRQLVHRLRRQIGEVRRGDEIRGERAHPSRMPVAPSRTEWRVVGVNAGVVDEYIDPAERRHDVTP